MMMRFRALTRVHSWMGVVQSVLTLASAVVSAMLKADPKKIALNLGNYASTIVVWMQENAWWLIPILLGIVAVLQWIRKKISPRQWSIVQSVLDMYRDNIFGNRHDDRHHHRVTLFKHVNFSPLLRRWPWSGWLIPVCRSGHTTQKSSSAFLAPDKADKVEGVVGKTWSKNSTVYVPDLPDLKSGQVTEADYDTYSTKTSTSKKLVMSRCFESRAYFGLPVEVNGQLWGVVVIDSRNPQIDKKGMGIIKRDYKLVAKFLGKVLEGL